VIINLKLHIFKQILYNFNISSEATTFIDKMITLDMVDIEASALSGTTELFRLKFNLIDSW